MDLYRIENDLRDRGFKNVLGTDEAGRGPMAGPLVAAAVILPPGLVIPGLNDSKKLSPKKREELYDLIASVAVEVQTEVISVEEIDRINVLEASKKAMRACIEKMRTPVDYVLADAVELELDLPMLGIIKGDAKAAAIAAASIIAKVTRDRLMVSYDEIYPEFGFKKHKGYVTKHHLEMLAKHGPCPLHRRSFAPVRLYFEND
ncbi:MAG: ribonuclease HII [Bacilli bacterium]|jgi:ribonuclease HII|nr:ribonuclease HII [Acholeplasmataceae bacterium]